MSAIEFIEGPLVPIRDPEKDFFDGMGLRKVAGGKFTLVDPVAARTWHRHRHFKPIAAVGWTLADEDFAKELLADYALNQLVEAAPAMCSVSGHRFAKVIGIRPLKGESDRYPARRALLQQMRRQVFPDDRVLGSYPTYGSGYESIRPIGLRWDRDRKIDKADLYRFQDYFERSPIARRVLIATLIWLLNFNDGSPWLDGFSCDWLAVDAIGYLQKSARPEDDVNLLEYWGKLIMLSGGRW